jgi:transposase-like protein
MATIAVSCPDCQSTSVIKAGKQPNGTQRYRCQNPTCERTIFQLTHVAHGRLPETQRQIVEMALNGSGIRDTARVLRVSPVTVLSVLKKRARLNRGQSSGVGHPGLRGHGRTAGQGGGGRSRRNVVFCR